MAGYSNIPLLKKLGIRDADKILLINPPQNYFELLGKDISSQLARKKQVPDFVHLFVESNKEFENHFFKLKSLWGKNKNLVIWVSWYKKTSGMATDLTENRIRELALKNDLVDIKVCAVSEQWSGLKLVVPVAKRI